jgi:hypothetical protein
MTPKNEISLKNKLLNFYSLLKELLNALIN